MFDDHPNHPHQLPHLPNPASRSVDAFLFAVLKFVELPIQAIHREKLLVTTTLADLSPVHHQNLIRVLDSRKAVGNDKRGAIGHQALHGLLDQELGLGIYARCGLVQHEDSRIVHERTNEG